MFSVSNVTYWNFEHRLEDRALKEGAQRAAELNEDQAEDAPEHPLVCGGCRHPITREELGVDIAGRHRHTCVNPAGIVYRIRCFGAAQGCIGHGEVTDYFSWFTGYAWQIALCQRCSMHLGWRFSGRDPVFFGLIADRLEAGP